MAVNIALIVLAAGIAAVIIPRIINIRPIVDQQFGPDPIDVDITGVVKHIRGKPTRRSHINFQGHILVSRRLEKFDVEKPFPHIKSP